MTLGKSLNLSVSLLESATKNNLYLIGSLGFNELINEKYFEEDLANSKHLSISCHHHNYYVIYFSSFLLNLTLLFFLYEEMDTEGGYMACTGYTGYTGYIATLAILRLKPVFSSH